MKKLIPQSRSASKKLILKKASELFRKSGYHGITVEQIAKELRLSKVSIYFYWRSKQEILYQIHRIAHKSLLEKIRKIVQGDKSPSDKLRDVISGHIDFACSEMSPTIAALQQEYALSGRYKKLIIKLRDEYDKLIRQIISQGIKKRAFRQLDPKLVSFVIIGAANYTQHWFSPQGSMSKEEIISKMTDCLMKGILSPQSLRRKAGSEVASS